MTCNTYLQKSGILGTVCGLLIGMAVIFVITWNLQYMIRNAPSAGGIYTFEKQVSGKDFGFLALWFVLLTYLAILWANITSVPLFARFFLGDTFQFGFHYTIFGYDVWLGEALLSIGTVILIGLLCAFSVRLPNGIMILAALAFVVGITVCAVLAAACHDTDTAMRRCLRKAQAHLRRSCALPRSRRGRSSASRISRISRRNINRSSRKVGGFHSPGVIARSRMATRRSPVDVGTGFFLRLPQPLCGFAMKNLLVCTIPQLSVMIQEKDAST